MFFACALALAPLALAAAVPQESYDFVVVGGGTAGIAVATRLSQRLRDHSVLIVEAGPDGRDEPGIYIPGRKGSTLGSRYDWNFTTVPQGGANNRVLGQNRGHVLGGSSALNLLSWDKAALADFDAWEELGNPEWNSENMFKAMRASEDYLFTPEGGPTPLPGTGDEGPINVLVNRLQPPQQDLFFPTMDSLGLDQTIDFLNGDLIGWMRHTSNIQSSNYTRSYSTAYLADAPENLHLIVDAEVAKVNIDDSKRATGITLMDGTVINASKEVILSAGSIQSPQLLEKSGVGAAHILEPAGIEQKVELPGVGENLQDHIRITTAYQLYPNYTSPDESRINETYAAQQLELWNNNQTGQLDSTSSGYAYMRWDQALEDDSYIIQRAVESASQNVIDQKKLENLQNSTKNVPQLELLFSDGYLGLRGLPTEDDELYGSNFFALIAVIMHPFSRGSSHINATAPEGHPIFDPRYVSNSYDIQAITEAAKYMRKVANTAPLNQAWETEYEPGTDVVETDADWMDYARDNVLSIWHPIGTCAMLPKENGGVVDPTLRVYGTQGLRVVDASVMPALISGHIQSAVYGIAERAAEIIATEVGTSKRWEQCGGKNWTGPTACVRGTTCNYQNEWYSQCI